MDSHYYLDNPDQNDQDRNCLERVFRDEGSYQQALVGHAGTFAEHLSSLQGYNQTTQHDELAINPTHTIQDVADEGNFSPAIHPADEAHGAIQQTCRGAASCSTPPDGLHHTHLGDTAGPSTAYNSSRGQACHAQFRSADAEIVATSSSRINSHGTLDGTDSGLEAWYELFSDSAGAVSPSSLPNPNDCAEDEVQESLADFSRSAGLLSAVTAFGYGYQGASHHDSMPFAPLGSAAEGHFTPDCLVGLQSSGGQDSDHRRGVSQIASAASNRWHSYPEILEPVNDVVQSRRSHSQTSANWEDVSSFHESYVESVIDESPSRQTPLYGPSTPENCHDGRNQPIPSSSQAAGLTGNFLTPDSNRRLTDSSSFLRPWTHHGWSTGTSNQGSQLHFGSAASGSSYQTTLPSHPGSFDAPGSLDRDSTKIHQSLESPCHRFSLGTPFSADGRWPSDFLEREAPVNAPSSSLSFDEARPAGVEVGPNELPEQMFGAIHTPDRPFRCDRLGCKNKKGFKTRSGLTHHRKIHNPEKMSAFKCQICDKGFRHPNMVKRHMSTHKLEDQESFACPYCGKIFYRDDHRDRHAITCSFGLGSSSA